MILNMLLLFVIACAIGILIYRIIKRDKAYHEERDNIYSIDGLTEGIKVTFNRILKTNIGELNLNKYETLKSKKNKSKLRLALKTCSYGDVAAKQYIKEYIKDLIQKKYEVNEETIQQVINFEDTNLLSIQDKFDIILQEYKNKYGLYALEKILLDHGLANAKYKDKEPYYEVTKNDIEKVYWHHSRELTFGDKLDIVAQRIYQQYKGHGIVDELRDMKIDGVSGGVSGLPGTYESVWIFFQGKTIHLSFLNFETEQELERVCKNIYRYDNPGQLSAAKGYITNDMKDGSRVIVVRPPFAESWSFFVRKFDSIKKAKVEDLITDEGNDLAIMTMKWLIKGCQVIGITGSQGCGKTTLVMALIQYINQTYTLRIQELTFELNLRKLYPERNILTFKETATVTGQEGLDLQKKTDGSVNILGEVAAAPVASWLVQVAQVASLFTIFTHHAKTANDLIISLRNALLQAGGFSSERAAEEQAAEAVRFDVHMNKSVSGHRYIERITEIIPISTHETKGRSFKTVDLVVFENNSYRLKNPISKGIRSQITKHLTEEEQVEFRRYLHMAGVSAYE